MMKFDDAKLVRKDNGDCYWADEQEVGDFRIIDEALVESVSDLKALASRIRESLGADATDEQVADCVEMIDRLSSLKDDLSATPPLTVGLHWTPSVVGDPFVEVVLSGAADQVVFDLREIPMPMLGNLDENGDGDLSHYFLGLAQSLGDMAKACQDRVKGRYDAVVHVDLVCDERKIPFSTEGSLYMRLKWLERALRENGHMDFARAASEASTMALAQERLGRE